MSRPTHPCPPIFKPPTASSTIYKLSAFPSSAPPTPSSPHVCHCRSTAKQIQLLHIHPGARRIPLTHKFIVYHGLVPHVLLRRSLFAVAGRVRPSPRVPHCLQICLKGGENLLLPLVEVPLREGLGSVLRLHGRVTGSYGERTARTKRARTRPMLTRPAFRWFEHIFERAAGYHGGSMQLTVGGLLNRHFVTPPRVTQSDSPLGRELLRRGRPVFADRGYFSRPQRRGVRGRRSFCDRPRAAQVFGRRSTTGQTASQYFGDVAHGFVQRIVDVTLHDIFVLLVPQPRHVTRGPALRGGRVQYGVKVG